ncbi:MAG TPA: bifunctional metallophosphatase/5'-nucleotidase, partial [Allosphingosinicella sp.]
MKIRNFAAAASLALAGCVVPQVPIAPLAEVGPLPVDVKIIAFNDFHGNLEPPKQSVEAAGVKVPAGGLAYLA